MPDLTPNVQNNGSTMLYAKWTEIKYSIEYDSNGGYGTMNSVVHTYDAPKKLSKNSFTKTYYSFGGWSTTKNGNVVYHDEESVCNLSSVQDAKVTLFAVWNEIVFKINYENNSQSFRMPVLFHTYGKKTILVDATSSSKSIFRGYYSSMSFTTRVYEIRADEVNPTVYIKFDKHLYGKSTAWQRTITDSGRFNQNFSGIPVNLCYNSPNTLSQFRFLRIEITMDIWEINDGYQYLFLYSKYENKDANILWQKKFEHGSGYKNTNPETKTFTILLNLSEVKHLETIYILYGASGAGNDDWCFKNQRVDAYLTDYSN